MYFKVNLVVFIIVIGYFLFIYIFNSNENGLEENIVWFKKRGNVIVILNLIKY